MKVKVGDKIYNAQDGVPLMVLLSKGEKKQIAEMLPHCTRYAQYPDEWTKEQAIEWMEEE